MIAKVERHQTPSAAGRHQAVPLHGTVAWQTCIWYPCFGCGTSVPPWAAIGQIGAVSDAGVLTLDRQ